jgi:hypothetical protein
MQALPQWLVLELSFCRIVSEDEGLNEDYKRPHEHWAHAEQLIAGQIIRVCSLGRDFCP